MKKFFVYIGCALSLLSIIFSSACELFNDTAKDQQVGNNDEVSQYWVEDCPITLQADILPSISNLQLVFVNSSDKKIIAYEAVFILYNVYGEALRFAWSDSIYNKLSETPYSFAPQRQDPQYVTITDAVYSAEIYVYYVLFEGQTSWGLRQDVTIDDIQKYCKCTKAVKE